MRRLLPVVAVATIAILPGSVPAVAGEAATKAPVPVTPPAKPWRCTTAVSRVRPSSWELGPRCRLSTVASYNTA